MTDVGSEGHGPQLERKYQRSQAFAGAASEVHCPADHPHAVC